MKKFFTKEVQLFIYLGMLTIFLSLIFDIPMLKSITFALVVLCFGLLKVLFIFVERVNKLTNSRQYRLTRIYNRRGIEVQNRWTEEIEDGYWVTIVTDPNKHEVVFAEHTRTDANITKNKSKCTEQEHAYNFSSVWGESYEGAKVSAKLIIAKN